MKLRQLYELLRGKIEPLAWCKLPWPCVGDHLGSEAVYREPKLRKAIGVNLLGISWKDRDLSLPH